jgi:hypothetical protein
VRVIGTLAPGGDTEAPTQPQNLQATAVNRQRIDLSWTSSTDNVGVAGYQVFRDGLPIDTTDAITYSDTTVTASTTYEYEVVAFDAAGNNSINSTLAQATTPANANPSWQTIPAQTLIVGDSFTLNLNNFCSDADADTIQYSDLSGSYPSGITRTGAIISGTPTTAGETPNITVGAFDGFATVETSISFETFSEDVTAPPVPTGLSATPGATSVSLTWNASVDAQGSVGELVSGTADYRVFRSTDGSNFSLRTTVSTPSYNDTGLSSNTTYHYKVTARDVEQNESAQSSAASATTAVGQGITTFTLTSAAASGTHPFYEAHEFAESEVLSGQNVVTDTAGVTLRVVPKARWPNNSLRHAILVGSASFTQNVANVITLKTGSAAGGTNLTASNIATALAAAGTTSVQCGAIGTVNITSLTASPFRTWISTPEMVECHYRSAVGSDADLYVGFHVRLWADGRMRVRAYVGNGYLNGSPTTRSYQGTIVIGGVTVYDAPVAHSRWSRWDAVGWIGTNPQITPSHDVAYLDASMAVPHFGWSASATALNGLTQSYTPMSVGALRSNTTGTAYHPSIGHHPLWDVAYFTTGDSRGYRAMDAAARAANVYALARPSSATNRHPRISDFPTTTYNNGSGSGTLTNDATTWDDAHAPHEAGGAYMVTGDYYHYETAMYAAQAWYFCRNSNGGSGVNRNLRGMQPRGLAWGLYIIGYMCAFAPTENADAADLAIVTDLRTWLSNVYTNFGLYIDVVGQTKLGITFAFSTGDWNGNGTIPPWMYNWWNGTNGRLRDLKPLADMTPIHRLSQFMYRFTVGMLGGGTANEFHFSRAAEYGVVVDPTATGEDFAPSETDFYDYPGEVWQATYGSPNAETTNVLQGSSASQPSSAPAGYWGYLRPALMEALDHGAPGALAGYRKMTGATNYSTILNSGFEDIPIMGWIPRTRTTALALAAAQLGVGQSIKLGTIPSSLLNIDGQGFSILQYGSSGVYDPFRGQCRFTGKRSSDGAPYRFLIYDEASHSWSINTTVWPGGEANQNGHGYDHNTMDPLTGNHIVRPYNSRDIWIWNGATWSSGTQLPAAVTDTSASSLTWHPKVGNNGALIYVDRRRIYKLVSGTWTQIQSFGSVSGSIHAVSEYNANSDLLVFGCGNTDTAMRKMTSLEVISDIADPGLNFGSSELHGLFIADPTGRGFIGWKKETTSWRHYNPDTNQWTPLTPSVGSGASPQNGVPPLSSAATGRHSICFSIDAYGVMMFVQYTGGSTGADVWLYRHT